MKRFFLLRFFRACAEVTNQVSKIVTFGDLDLNLETQSSSILSLTGKKHHRRKHRKGNGKDTLDQSSNHVTYSFEDGSNSHQGKVS